MHLRACPVPCPETQPGLAAQSSVSEAVSTMATGERSDQANTEGPDPSKALVEAVPLPAFLSALCVVGCFFGLLFLWGCLQPSSQINT